MQLSTVTGHFFLSSVYKMFKCTTILQTVYQALKYISEYILQCYAVLFQNTTTVHLPQKSPLFMLCSLLHFHAYEPFERNMCTKVSCHLPSQKCYQNDSFPRTNIVNLWLIGKPWKILVEVQKVFVMQLALFACKKCSFFYFHSQCSQ